MHDEHVSNAAALVGLLKPRGLAAVEREGAQHGLLHHTEVNHYPDLSVVKVPRSIDYAYLTRILYSLLRVQYL